MTRQISRETCRFCGESFAGSTMARHLKVCKARAEKIDESAVKGPQKGSAKRTIDLDQFLRSIWLECCGHLSSFEIGGQTFISEKYDPGDRSMKVALGKVIAPGMKFEHVYDFGTSTVLSLKLISSREGLAQGKSVKILARNEPPEIKCQSCGKPATKVCCQCIYEGEGWLCDDCAKKHECGEDKFLPVVNSPRVGMCGYTGNVYD